MRYIRTEDGIYEYEKVKTRVFVQKGFYSEEKTLSEEESLKLFPYEIIKQADTIEELCDEFVYEILTGEDEEPMYRDIHSARIGIKTQLKIYEDEMAGVRAIYGAIWTEKGLKYIAKMNEKGELELL